MGVEETKKELEKQHKKELLQNKKELEKKEIDFGEAGRKEVSDWLLFHSISSGT